MESYIPIAIFVVTLAVILLMAYYFSASTRMLRELKKSPPRAPQSLNNGAYEKVVGKALHVGELLTAPLSGRPCVFFQIKVRQKRGKNTTTIINHLEGTDFFLDCKGEWVIISMEESKDARKIFLKKDHKDGSRMFKDATPAMVKYLKSRGYETTNLLGFNKTFYYEEGIVEPGELLAVKGVAQWKTITEPIPGFSYSKILSLKGSGKQKLYLTDLPKATQTK